MIEVGCGWWKWSTIPLGGWQGAPVGRVRVLEDADSDGYYERGRIFAEGLSFPMASWCGETDTGDGGAEILFLRDRDGEGRAR